MLSPIALFRSSWIICLSSRNFIKFNRNKMRESHTYIQKKALFSLRIKFSDGFPSQISTYIFLLNGVSLCSVLNYLLDQSPLGIHYQNGNAEQNIIFTYGSSIFFGYHAHHFMRGIHMCLCCFFFLFVWLNIIVIILKTVILI